MICKKSTLLILACLLLTSTAWCAGGDTASSPEALISRARSQEELWTEGTPPMMMRAELQVSDGKGGLTHGEYTFDWASPSEWREEIRFANYIRIRVGDAKGYWQTSELNHQPEVIFLVDKLLHLKDAAMVGAKQTLGKVNNRKNAGVLQNCTEVKWRSGTDRTLCFDDSNGTLISIEYPAGENQHPREISRIEYSSFNAVAGKLVPYEVQALTDRKVIAAVKVLEISKVTEENPALFAVPANAEFWAQCDDMQEPEPVDQSPPRYPANARANHEQGRVITYAVIEADGSLSHMAIIQGAARELEAATLETLHQWHYKPAACGNTPIRVETSIETDFWMGP
jgi:TonB family protein